VIDKLTDEEILEAYRIVTAIEGVFCETAPASSIAAGLIHTISVAF
jgi:threonine synthase